MEPDGCLTRDPRKLVGLEELLPLWRARRRIPSGKRVELSVGRDAERYRAGLSIAAALGHSTERTGKLLPNFLWPGVPPAEHGDQLKLLRRKAERSLEGKAHPSNQFPSATGIAGFGEQSCVSLFLTFTWQSFVFKCWQAATQAGSLYMMDALRCSVITLSADSFVCSLLPPSDSGRKKAGARFLPWKL